MSGSQQEVFQAVLTALDHASPALREVQGALRKMRGEAKQAGEATKQLGHEAAQAGAQAHELSRLGRALTEARARAGSARHSFGELGESFGGVGERLAEMMPALAGFGALGSIAGVFELTHQATEMADVFKNTALRVGTTTDVIQQFDYAAKMADVSVEGMHIGMQKLGAVLGQVQTGGNKIAAGLLKALHIPLKDAKGNVRAISDVMLDLSEAFEKNKKNAPLEQMMARTLMGKGGAELIPLLIQGREKMMEMRHEFGQFGYTLTELDKGGLNEFDDRFKQLGTAMEGFRLEVGSKLAPVLAPVVAQMTDWVAANRDWIATGIAQSAQDFTQWISRLQENGTLRDIADRMADVASAGKAVFGALGPGGVETAVGLLVGGELLAWLGRVRVGAAAAREALMALGGEGVLSVLGPLIARLMAGSTAAAAIAAAILLKPTTANADENAQLADLHNQEREARLRFWRMNHPGALYAPKFGGPETAESVGEDARRSSQANYEQDQRDALAAARRAEIDKGLIERHRSTTPYSDPQFQMPGLMPPSGYDGYPVPAAPLIPGAFQTPLAMPSPFQSAFAGQAAGGSGQTTIRVTFENAPPGMRVTTDSTGDAPSPSVRVGYAFAGDPQWAVG